MTEFMAMNDPTFTAPPDAVSTDTVRRVATLPEDVCDPALLEKQAANNARLEAEESGKGTRAFRAWLIHVRNQRPDDNLCADLVTYLEGTLATSVSTVATMAEGLMISTEQLLTTYF